MLSGLKEGQDKMSKSDPDSAIFMEDTAAEVRSKVSKAYCPPGIIAGNPCLDWTKTIIFAKHAEVVVRRSAANGGDKAFASYAEVEADFVSGALHPGDLKAMIIEYINACVAWLGTRIRLASGRHVTCTAPALAACCNRCATTSPPASPRSCWSWCARKSTGRRGSEKVLACSCFACRCSCARKQGDNVNGVPSPAHVIDRHQEPM